MYACSVNEKIMIYVVLCSFSFLEKEETEEKDAM